MSKLTHSPFIGFGESDDVRRRHVRLVCAVLGVFGGATGAWVLYAFTLSGDAFVSDVWLIVTLLVGAGISGYAAFQVRSLRGLLIVSVLALISGGYWVFVPNGWWAAPPPTVGHTS